MASQAPLSMGFSRQAYWSGLPFLSPGDLPDPETEPGSPTLQADFLPSEPPGKLPTMWTSVSKVIPLLFNTLSRLVIPFLPRSKHLLILWLQSPSEVILEPKKVKSCHCFHFLPLLSTMKWWDQMPCLSFFNVELQAGFFTLLLPSLLSIVDVALLRPVSTICLTGLLTFKTPKPEC